MVLLELSGVRRGVDKKLNCFLLGLKRLNDVRIIKIVRNFVNRALIAFLTPDLSSSNLLLLLLFALLQRIIKFIRDTRYE